MSDTITSGPLTYLSLFTGIGGLDHGLDQAGWTCVGQVETDPYCQQTLERHWPEVPKHDDVRTTPTWWNHMDNPPTVRLVAGGFPCQPFSIAGRRLGEGDSRWGWPWFRDVIRAIRPPYVLVENVPGLLTDIDAFGRILGDLAEDGFNAEWSVLSACTLGAPHTRERLFLVGYAPSNHGPEPLQHPAKTGNIRRIQPRRTGSRTWPNRWLPEPTMDRVAHGLPRHMVYPPLHALGNAVCPPVAQLIGQLIREHIDRATP